MRSRLPGHQLEHAREQDVQECIDKIGRIGSLIFSTINLTSGFWQMMLNPECRNFTLPGFRQFEWNASPTVWACWERPDHSRG